MDIKKTLVVLLVFLFFISSVYAQDFGLFPGKFYEFKEGQEKIEFEFYNGTYAICENEKKSVPMLIVNNANTDEKYSLNAFGANWASLNAREFSLPKKQSGAVFLELNPSSNTKGKYSVGVNVFSSSNARKGLILDINVERCHSLKLELEKEEDKVCGDTKKQYSGEIANDGQQRDDIGLILTAPNWITPDKTVFSVSPGNKEKFELIADIPANAKGHFSVVLSAAAKNLPSVRSEKKLGIEVVPKYDCYKADIMADEKIPNSYSNEYAQIKIRNSGIKQAAYEISMEAPNWISIEPRTLTVNPEQTGSVNLNINPDEEVPEGAYNVKIHAKFDDNVYTKNIEIALIKKQFFKGLKPFLVFYQYYIYVALIAASILIIFRRQISNKIKNSYKNYKVRQARLKALEAARKARQLKRQKQLEQAKFEVKKVNRYRRNWILFLAILLAIASSLFVAIYKYNFPVSKEFVKNYGGYLTAGIMISLFIIFLIEFYKPLFRLLKKVNKKK